MRRRRLALPGALALAALAALAACDLGEETVAPGRDRPVVHAVLDPFTGLTYEMLLERTLTGRVTVSNGAALDSLDAIASAEGVPISGARVELRDTAGLVAVGVEDAAARADGKGRGVYRFQNRIPPIVVPGAGNEMLLVRGRRYTLHVTTPEEVLVTGTTTIPFTRIVPDTMPVRVFDRERDSYPFTWPRAEAVHRYAVQIQSPFGPFEIFTPDSSMDLDGGLRNPLADQLPPVFVPGFLQTVQVLAVDTNYFDYYRSANDPFTGTGIINHLDGGRGVFGSVVAIRTSRLDVVAPIDEPGEGEWVSVADGTPSPTRIIVYFTGRLVSLRWDDPDDRPTRQGMYGSRDGSRLRFPIRLVNGDEVDIIGELTATSLVLRYPDGRERRFVRPAAR
jgi:hypothetical protein